MAAGSQRNENSYEDGGGYGKFRKRPFRRVSTTPYDRPQTAIRNPCHAGNSNGWLSKIVDPAQRLITSSAHKLFSSVFRKRLPPPPPPPQPLEPEANGGASGTKQEAVCKDPFGLQGSVSDDIDFPASSSDRGGLTELELMLKQKTFTRSEIDRLTALLHSRNIDLPAGNEDWKKEAFPSKAALSLDRKEEFPNTPVKDNGLDSHRLSTPIVGSSVVDEDVASPAELAKAYMGSRPSKISPSALGLRGQPVVENAVAQNDRPFASNLPIMPFVARSSCHVVPITNRFSTPRSRGRSAIYSMARTPYSRVHSISTHQGAGTEIDAFSAPSSSSQRIWESGRFSGSKQGALKRGMSVLDNDIGSVGPIRRIRQKSNLLATSGTRSGRGTGHGSEAVDDPLSAQKQVLASEPSIGNGNNNIHGSGIISIPSKSSEMASKILQQLDVLVSSRDKSPSKLSPSMLRGPALRSLENADSSKFLETVQDNNKADAKHDSSLPDVRGSISQKQVMVEENGSVKLSAYREKSASALNDVNLLRSRKNDASDVKTISFENSVVQASPKTKRAFQMSAHEDYLEVDDDDDRSDRNGSAALSEVKDRPYMKLAENKTNSAVVSTVEKPATSLQAKPHASSMLGKIPLGASDGFSIAKNCTALSDQAASLPDVAVQQPVEEKQPTVKSDKFSSPEYPSLVSVGDKIVSPKEPNGVPNFSFKTEGSVPQLAFASTSPVLTNSMNQKFSITSDPKSECSSSFSFGVVNATNSLTKDSESEKIVGKNNWKGGVLTESMTSAVSMSSPATSLFSFGLPANASSINGSLASTRSFSSSPAALISQSISGPNTTSSSTTAVASTTSSTVVITATAADISNSSGLCVSASAPSFMSAPALRFSSSLVPSTSTSSVSATTGVESTESKRSETSLGNLTSVTLGSASSSFTSSGSSLLGDPSSALKSPGSSIFSGTSAVASNDVSSAVTNTSSSMFNFNAGASASAATTNQSQGFNPFSAASAQASAASTLISTQSLPIQFSSSASSPFGFNANTAPSSGSSLFSSSGATGKLFSSGVNFGLSTSTSEASPVSSTSTTTIFGFGSAFNSASSSTGFVFGVSSASNAVTSTTSMMFGPSAGASSGAVFNFSSAASVTQLQPPFANPSPGHTFGSSTSGNTDQMNMEDSMAEDTVQATSTVPVFGQQSIAAPSSGFVFCSTTPPGGNQFVSTPTVPQALNHFQFASQPNLAAPQNQSLFQASGSLEFNAGGSFSLGTPGGDKSTRRVVRIKKTQRKK